METPVRTRIHWWMLSVAIMALFFTIVVGLTQIIPQSTPVLAASGALILMIVAVLVMIAALTTVFVEVLTADEQGAFGQTPVVPANIPVGNLRQEQPVIRA